MLALRCRREAKRAKTGGPTAFTAGKGQEEKTRNSTVSPTEGAASEERCSDAGGEKFVACDLALDCSFLAFFDEVRVNRRRSKLFGSKGGASVII